VSLTFTVPPQPAATLFNLIAADKGGGEATLDKVLTIKASSSDPVLEVELCGLDRYRFGTVSRIDARYRNTGDAQTLAPLVLVRAMVSDGSGGWKPSPNTRLGLQGDEDLQGDEKLQGNRLLFLAVDSDAVAGILSAGRDGSLPFVYHSTEPPGQPVRFEISVFRPGPEDYVAWDLQSPLVGMSETWNDAWPGLSVNLGASWVEVHESLSALATGLARRGLRSHSLRDRYRFATRQALGLSTGAVIAMPVSMTARPLSDGNSLSSRVCSRFRAPRLTSKVSMRSTGSGRTPT
jgi:hypothetical protein